MINLFSCESFRVVVFGVLERLEPREFPGPVRSVLDVSARSGLVQQEWFSRGAFVCALGWQWLRLYKGIPVDTSKYI